MKPLIIVVILLIIFAKTTLSGIPDSVTFHGIRYKTSFSNDSLYIHLDNDTFHTSLIYYSKNNNQLYERIANNQSLEFSFIEDLNLSKVSNLAKSRKNVLFFNNSLIVDVSNDVINTDNDGKYIFYKDIIFYTCTFINSVSFSDCSFKSGLFIYNSYFTNELSFLNSEIANFILHSCVFMKDFTVNQCHVFNYSYIALSTFNSKVVIGDNPFIRSSNRIVNENWKPEKHEIYVSNEFDSMIGLYDSKFHDTVIFTNSLFRDSIYANSEFGSLLYFGGAFFCSNVDLGSSIIYKEVFFKKTNFVYKTDSLTSEYSENVRNLENPNCTFILNKTYFANNCKVTPDENIDKLTIDLDDWNRILINTDMLDSNRSVRLLNNFLKYFNNLQGVPKELRQNVIERINWQLYEVERLNSKGFEYLWSQFLKITVNYGYQGTLRFLKISGGIILFFSFIFLFFRKEISIYLSFNLFKKDKMYKKLAHNINLNLYYKHTFSRIIHYPKFIFLEYIQCLWFSFSVFLSPKFTLNYFKLSETLQYFIILEWLIGFALLIVFFIFIASKYSFIRSLIGV